MRATVLACLSGIFFSPTSQLLAQDPERWALVRDIRIGSEDRPNYALSRVGDAAIGPAGDIYLTQPQEKLIRQFDARGIFVRSIGRSGAGPGEFQALERIGWKGDTLWAVDPVQYRANLFSGRGQVLGTTGKAGPIVTGTGYPTGPSALLNDGSVLGRPTPSTSSVRDGTATTLPLLRMNRDGAVQGGFGSIEVLGEYTTVRRARLRANLDLPLPHNSLWDVAPDGSTVAVVHRGPATSEERASFRVASYQASGRVIFDRVYRYTPRALPPASRDSIHEMLVNFFVQTGFTSSAGQARSFARDSVPLPRFQPPVTDVAVGRDGTIWLGRERHGVRTVEYLVLGRDGRILAFVAAPVGVRILQAQRDVVWGVEADELGVPYLVRFRVTSAR